MTIMEIALLIIGIVVFVASFRIPVGKAEKMQTDYLNEEEIQKLVQIHVEEASSKITESVDETVTYAVEKAERALDRLTNEKIMAVNEYADTVLSDIHKNHEEVVFLYDMLNDKQTHLKNTVKEAEQTAKTVSKTTKKAEETASRVQQVEETAKETVKAAEEVKETGKNISEQDKGFQPFVIPNISREEVKRQTEKNKRKKAPARTLKEAEGEGEVDAQAAKRPIPQIITSDSSEPEMVERNRNEEILALHKAGKSNMVIAKELGLGVGEVKLVIDLFKGI